MVSSDLFCPRLAQCPVTKPVRCFHTTLPWFWGSTVQLFGFPKRNWEVSLLTITSSYFANYSDDCSVWFAQCCIMKSIKILDMHGSEFFRVGVFSLFLANWKLIKETVCRDYNTPGVWSMPQLLQRLIRILLWLQTSYLF